MTTIGQDLLAVTIVVGLAAWIYSKNTGKSFKELSQDIKKLFGGG